MEATDKNKNESINDQNSTASANKLIPDDNKTVSDDQLPNQRDPSPIEKQEKSKAKQKKDEPSPPQSPLERPAFRGPFGISTASTIIWYICICILFVIAFVCLVLSLLYFIGDTTTEQVIKLYGICGSGSLAVVTFVIVFLDCCNDGGKKDHEQEAIYRVLKAKEEKEKELTARYERRVAEGIEKPLPFFVQHQEPEKVPETTDPHPHPYHHRTPHHVHHVHPFPATSYHHPFVCPVCHDLHASGNARHNFTDVAVDTSDKFAPVRKSNKTVHKSTRDVQTDSKQWDSERGTQTDRTEGTQTSHMELSGMPSNITQIIHETTILKAPRSLLGTLKNSLAKQDKDIAINRAVTDTNTTTATII